MWWTRPESNRGWPFSRRSNPLTITTAPIILLAEVAPRMGQPSLDRVLGSGENKTAQGLYRIQMLYQTELPRHVEPGGGFEPPTFGLREEVTRTYHYTTPAEWGDENKTQQEKGLRIPPPGRNQVVHSREVTRHYHNVTQRWGRSRLSKNHSQPVAACKSLQLPATRGNPSTALRQVGAFPPNFFVREG